MAQLWKWRITVEETDISLWSLLCHLPAAISGSTVKTRETQSQFCKTASMWTSIKSSAWHGSLSRNSCPIQTPQYISFSLCASLHPSFSKGPVGEWFPPKIIYSYGLTGMKGDILFMSLSTCLMLKLLLLEKNKVILTSFLMTLRFSSRFTIRNLTVEIKKNIVKYSSCNMSLHKLASPFLCSSIHVSLFTSEMLRSFSNQPFSEPPTQRALSGRLIHSCVLQNPTAFT